MFYAYVKSSSATSSEGLFKSGCKESTHGYKREINNCFGKIAYSVGGLIWRYYNPIMLYQYNEMKEKIETPANISDTQAIQ